MDKCSLSRHSILGQLFEVLPAGTGSGEGHYDPETQTWSSRNAAQMSPVKNNQEE